jgi:nickel transport protein
MKPIISARIVLIIVLLLFNQPASAHFGMIIPSDSVISASDNTTIHLELSFAHPFEQEGMPLVKPRLFGVATRDTLISLLPVIKQSTNLEQMVWKARYKLKRPGIYTFYMEPQPYWEETEDCYIVHYTKTVVSAFGDDEGWDNEIGLKTEIVPVTRPFGLYAGNIFQGIVKLNGKPVPGSIVEVEFLNPGKKAKAPNELMITQTIKADQNGLFSYAAPTDGWWGFAALNPADYQLTRKGAKKDVELGAVIWVKFHKWTHR